MGRADGLQLQVMDYGATIRRLSAPSVRGPIDVIPYYPDLAAYAAGKAYLNALVGRFANRLDHGRFNVDGETFQISRNEGANTLHGGVQGLNRRIWAIREATADTVVFAYVSPDGEEGFPGRLDASLTLHVADDALTLAYVATTDRPTVVNLTQHLYFNLSGREDATILDHTLHIAASAITEVRPDLIPTGRLRPVAGTPFNFRQPRPLGEAVRAHDPQIAIASGIDHNFVLDAGAQPQARLHSPESGLTLELTTDQPGLQVYTGQGMPSPFVKFGAVALEPQGFPDAPNHPGFPNAVLRPGQVYRHTSTYRFRA